MTLPIVVPKTVVERIGEHREYDQGRSAFTRVMPYENFYLVKDAYGSRCFSRGAWQARHFGRLAQFAL